MLAARLWGQDDVRVETIDDPGPPPDGWVTVRVEACGICGTDVEEYTCGPTVVPVAPHPLTGRCAPLTLGHEAVGIVEERGRGAALDLGTRVAIEGNLYCGECWWCRRHSYQLCERMAALGLMGDGGLAEIMVAPAAMCLPIDASVDPARAAIAEPLSVAVRAVHRAGVRMGTSIAIVGAGTVGLLLIQAARLAGATTIVSVEHVEERRRLAVRLGADLAVPPEQAHTAVHDLVGTPGIDVTIEAAGNAAAAALAVRLVRRGGRAVLLGVFDAAVPVDMMDLLLGEKEVVASLSHVYDTDFATAVDLINGGAIETESMITDRIPLADVVEKGFKALVADPAAHLKIVVLPGLPPSATSIS